MIENLDQTSLHILSRLYDTLRNNIIQSKKKLIKNSAFLTLLKLSSNDTYKIISISSLKIESYYSNEVSVLKRNNFINTPDDKDKIDELVINVHGIWYIEKINNIINWIDVLDYIQSTKLGFPKVHQALNDNEKIIIFSMVAVRTFSEEVAMDLSTDHLRDGWQDIIENEIIPFLVKTKMIKSGLVIDRRTGNENPISYLLRHANDLPQKTKNLFSPTKKFKYYLALNIEDRGKCIPQVSFLLNKIMTDIDFTHNNTNVFTFLCDVAHNKSLFVNSSFEFVNNQWDHIINNSLEQLYLGIDMSSLY